jgi:antitoxin (DNA-binding transcriptional repressor) of toxin-antitoxin stability system
MKSVDAGQFAANVNQYLLDSRSEVIVVTQAGKPCAVIQGLDYDEEQLQLANSQDFWNLIQQRRKSSTIPWDVAKQRLKLDGE